MEIHKQWHPLLAVLVMSMLVGYTDAQLRLQSPKRLFDKLVASKAISEETFYTLIGSTASFGTPSYGTTLRCVRGCYFSLCATPQLVGRRGYCAVGRMLYRNMNPCAGFAVLRGRAFYTPDPRRMQADGTEAGFHCDPSYCAELKADIDSWKASQLQGGLGHVSSPSWPDSL